MTLARVEETRERLGETLVRMRRINESELQRALDAQQVNGRRLGTNLLMMGYLEEDELAYFLSQQLEVQSVNRIDPVDPEIRELVPESLAQLHQVFPLGLEGDALRLAMADPSDEAARREVEAATGYRVAPVVAPELVVTHAIFRQYAADRPPETLDIDADDVKMSVGLLESDSLSIDLTV